MSNLFKPYEGKRPYFFISYPHKQSDEVVQTIRILHDKKYRLWYDEGIPAGSDWPANIAQHLQDCRAVICFISDHFLKSQNCFSEIRAAVQLGKPILAVYLDDSVPEGPWKELLDGCKSIPVLPTPQERAKAILGASFVRRRFRRKLWEQIPWQFFGVAASLLMFLGSAGVFGVAVTGYWAVPEQVAVPASTEAPTKQTLPPVVLDLGDAERFFALEFPDSQQERAIRDILGIETETILAADLAPIRELYFCGNMVLKNSTGIVFDEAGNCRVNGARVIEGSVKDLDLIGKLMYLENLALICQPVTDLESLNELVLLQELSLAGSHVSSVSDLRDLQSLEILHLEHTNVVDLTPLEQLSRLKIVTVSLDMLPLSWSQDAQFEVILIH